MNTNKNSNKELNARALLAQVVALLSDIKTDLAGIKTDIADIQARIANNFRAPVPEKDREHPRIVHENEWIPDGEWRGRNAHKA